MKKMILLLSSILLIASVSNAQDSTAKKQKAMQSMDTSHRKGITKEDLKQLNLTKDQEKQIEDIQANTKKQKDAINADSSVPADQKQEKIKAMEKEAKGKIMDLLTPDQKTKLKSLKGKPAGQ